MDTSNALLFLSVHYVVSPDKIGPPFTFGGRIEFIKWHLMGPSSNWPTFITWLLSVYILVILMQFLLTRSFDKYIVLTCTEADIGIPPSISSAAIFLYYFILIRERNVGWESIFIKYLLKKIEHTWFFGYQNGIKQGCTRFITGFQNDISNPEVT